MTSISNSTSEGIDLKKRQINSSSMEQTETQKVESINEKKELDLQNVIYTLTSGAIGFSFGFILEKCKVYDPKFIRQQMIFNKFLMMKMFFTALGTSTLSILILNLVAKNRYNKVLESYRDSLKPKSFLVVTTGGLILGLGMQIAGSCPGMMYIQLGAGVGYSFLTILGGLTGAYLHGILNNYMTKNSQPDEAVSKTLFEVLNFNANKTRLALISALYGGVFLMEFLVPWRSDYELRNANSPLFGLTSEVWPPALAGICLGSLQFLSIFFMSKSLGASSSFSTLASFLLSEKKLQNFSYLKRFRSGLANMGTLVFVGSSIMGSFVSSKLSGVYAQANTVNPYNAFLGGFLLVFGARLAGGCNTGHGISGTSHLFLGSTVAMMSMFAGGIALGCYALTNNFFF